MDFFKQQDLSRKASRRLVGLYALAVLCMGLVLHVLISLLLSFVLGENDAEWMIGKIEHLRVFSDSEGKMNLNVRQVGGSLLLVSQFTLFGDCRKGTRPSYDTAMPTDKARELYDLFCGRCQRIGVPVVFGVFQASMKVDIENDGPVTLLLDSKKTF